MILVGRSRLPSSVGSVLDYSQAAISGGGLRVAVVVHPPATPFSRFRRHVTDPVIEASRANPAPARKLASVENWILKFWAPPGEDYRPQRFFEKSAEHEMNRSFLLPALCSSRQERLGSGGAKGDSTSR